MDMSGSNDAVAIMFCVGCVWEVFMSKFQMKMEREKVLTATLTTTPLTMQINESQGIEYVLRVEHSP